MICPECGEEMTPEWVDYSFSYTYGSIDGVHHDGQFECPYCDSPVDYEPPEKEWHDTIDEAKGLI